MNYEVIQPNRELRAYARRQLKGVWGAMALTYFVYSLLYIPYYFVSTLASVISSIDEYAFLSIPFYLFLDSIDTDIETLISIINFILSLAVLLTAGPFVLGFSGYFLKRVRGEEIAIKNIFDGFKSFFSSFGVWFFTGLFTGLWSLLFIIPGIVKALAYSMAYYIMYDNPGIGPLEAIKKSQIMMKGYKWKYFLLHLSFIGWAILAVLTFGIGFLWLYPYINLSLTNFYENLKRNQENGQEAKRPNSPVDLFQST